MTVLQRVIMPRDSDPQDVRPMYLDEPEHVHCHWTAYFHLRNRLVLAALHTPDDVRKTLLRQGLRTTIGRLLNLRYSTVAIEQKALDDFLAGPDRLFEMLRTALPEVQEIRTDYPPRACCPRPASSRRRRSTWCRPSACCGGRAEPVRLAARASVALPHNLRPPDASAAERPQVNVPASSALWYLLGNLDSATVSNADGSGVAFRHRDPKLFRELSRRAVKQLPAAGAGVAAAARRLPGRVAGADLGRVLAQGLREPTLRRNCFVPSIHVLRTELSRTIGGLRESINNKGLIKTAGRVAAVAGAQLAFTLTQTRRQGDRFTFRGDQLPYTFARYNNSFLNERAVEISIAKWFLAGNVGRVLEVGNVLAHYGVTGHTVLDKYEVIPGVLNDDIVDFKPETPFDTVVAISTLEHVGWDETPREPEKVFRAIENVKNCVGSEGKVLVTVPIGHNQALDAGLRSGEVKFPQETWLVRTNRRNDWVEADRDEALARTYGEPFTGANGLYVGTVSA